MGYERIKEKVNTIRQDYRKAAKEGHRSDGGKLVCDNWGTLETMWREFPTVTSLTNSVSSFKSS